MSQFPSRLRQAGSPWLTAVLLMLILFALACATVYESTHGPESASWAFYRSTWFQLLLLVFAVNLGAALASRFPWTIRQAGFVLTHSSILLILFGACLSHYWGIDGQVTLIEGQETRQFTIPQESLMIERTDEPKIQASALLEISGRTRQPIDQPPVKPLQLGTTTACVEQYLPDSQESEQAIEDPAHGQPAIKVQLTLDGQQENTWVFAEPNTHPTPWRLRYRIIADPQAWESTLHPTPASDPLSKGTVKIQVQEQSFSYPLEECLGKSVPLGNTGYTLNVQNFLPHATVSAERKLENVSNKPVNPAIEAELTKDGTITPFIAFARFPEFASLHKMADGQNIKMVLEVPRIEEEPVPVEILAGPQGKYRIKLNQLDAPSTIHDVKLGQPIPLPWADAQLTLVRAADKVRIQPSVVVVDPPRENAIPAVRVTLTDGPARETLWLRRGDTATAILNTTTYRLSYAYQRADLGFTLRLNSFRIGYYPGTHRPRSFESRITFIDPRTGQEQDRLISMNNPATFGGYTFHQSSYHENGRGQGMSSVLSVSWDPGQPVVFAGYIGLILGMLWVIVQRIRPRRSLSAAPAAG